MRALALALALVCACGTARAQTPAVAALQPLLRAATVIVDGVVEAGHASPVDGVAAGPHAVTVRVLDTVRVPPVLRALGGQRVLVHLGGDAAPAVGTRARWYAVGWLAGAGTALRALAYVATPTADAARALERQERDALAANERDDLCAALRGPGATAVVAATVAGLRTVRGAPVVAGSEHDPRWRETTLRTLAVFRDDSGAVGATFTLLTSGSNHLSSMYLPRPDSGTAALYLLRPAGGYRRLDSAATFVPWSALGVRAAGDTTLARAIVRGAVACP